MKKTLDIVSIDDAKSTIPDLDVHGNGDLWQLLCKASSESEGWMKSTKVMEIIRPQYPDDKVVGCLVQVTTQQGDHVAEAITYVPNVEISQDGKRLIGV